RRAPGPRAAAVPRRGRAALGDRRAGGRDRGDRGVADDLVDRRLADAALGLGDRRRLPVLGRGRRLLRLLPGAPRSAARSDRGAPIRMKGIAMRRLARTGLAFLCCGCAVGPNFARPDPPDVDRYGSDVVPARIESADGAAVRLELGNEIADEWWTLFRSPDLDRVVAQAVSANPTLAAARATLTQARET